MSRPSAVRSRRGVCLFPEPVWTGCFPASVFSHLAHDPQTHYVDVICCSWGTESSRVMQRQYYTQGPGELSWDLYNTQAVTLYVCCAAPTEGMLSHYVHPLPLMKGHRGACSRVVSIFFHRVGNGKHRDAFRETLKSLSTGCLVFWGSLLL